MSNPRFLAPGTRTVRLDRLQEYSEFNVATISRGLGLNAITLGSLNSVVPFGPRDGHDKHSNHAGRIRYFVENPSEADPILISNGVEQGLSPDEPFLFDGRHRFIAAILRGDSTIKASFGFTELPRQSVLPRQVIDYLSGSTNTKP
jgi:hypothetical protein